MAYAVFKKYNSLHIHIGVPLLQKVFIDEQKANEYMENEKKFDKKDFFIWKEVTEVI